MSGWLVDGLRTLALRLPRMIGRLQRSTREASGRMLRVIDVDEATIERGHDFSGDAGGNRGTSERGADACEATACITREELIAVRVHPNQASVGRIVEPLTYAEHPKPRSEHRRNDAFCDEQSR